MRNVEIRVFGRARAHTDCLIGEAHGERVSVGVRVDLDGLDAKLLASTNDPNRDLAAVGNKDFTEHYCP
jgi:hypothetical protein